MKTRTELLNWLADTFDLKYYLEIGVQNRVNFDQIRVENKIGVDPDLPNSSDIFGLTSDRFFEELNTIGNHRFDLVFIDGLHHADQVKKDFENAMNHLSDRGFIVFHDALPAEEIHAKVPRESKVWNGDVYRFIFQLNNYDGINFLTADFDHGCTVVWKDPSCKSNPITGNIDWAFYLANRDLLRVKNSEEVKYELEKTVKFTV